MAQFALPQPQFDNSSDTLSSFPQASSKPCLPATLTPPQRAWCLPCSQARLAPLRSSYLKRLVESGEALQKRQDLPEAAFWDVAAFQRLTESEIAGSSIFALSYRWLTAEHPDPDSFHLSKVVAFLEVHKAWVDQDRGHQRGRLRGLLGLRLAVPAGAHPRSEGVVPRGSAGEQRVVRQCPHDGPDPVAPSSRVHRHAVQSKRVVFRGSDDQFRHQGSFTRFDTGALELDSAGNLVMDEDFETVMRRCSSRRCVPLRPDVVRHLLHTEKKVYDGRGQGSRGGLVRELLQRRRWQLHRVELHYLDWTDKEIRDLAGSLQFFEKLEELDLREQRDR